MSASQIPEIPSLLSSEVVIVPVGAGSGVVDLGSILTSTGISRCLGVMLYSPLDDGVYTDNTDAIMVGGPETAAGTGYPLQPGEIIRIPIDDVHKVWLWNALGTQLLVVTVSM